MGFGGDATCMLSPSLYGRYGAAWDARLFEHAGTTHRLPNDAPCNLHSCGASGHLYGLWSEHPCRGNIATMQTRLLPGRVGRLRESFPPARLELTIHPPEFDVATAEAGAVKELLWHSASDAGGRDTHFVVVVAVHRPEDLPRAERNLRACHEAMTEIRKAAAGT